MHDAGSKGRFVMEDALASALEEAVDEEALRATDEDARETHRGDFALSVVDEDEERDVQVLILDQEQQSESTPRDAPSAADSECVEEEDDPYDDDLYPKWMRHSFPSHELTAVAALRSQCDDPNRATDTRQCDECNKREVVFSCADCVQALCFICTDAIHVVAALSTHAIVRCDHERGPEDIDAPHNGDFVALEDPAPVVADATSDPVGGGETVAPPSRLLNPATQVEHRLHLPIGTKLFFRADDCGRWPRELLHGSVVGLDHGVRSAADGVSFYYRVLWLRGVEALANGFFRATLVLPRPCWPVEIGLFPSQLSALRAVLTAERLARAALRRERVSGRWRDVDSEKVEPTTRFTSVEIVNEILDETETILGHEFRTRLTQQDDAAFLRAVGSGAWQYDTWMTGIGREVELREEAAAVQETDDELAGLARGRLSAAAELLLLWSPRDRVRLFLLEQRELLLPEPVQRAHIASIIKQMLFVYVGFAWQRWRKFVARHRRHEQRQRREAAATCLARWWQRQSERLKRLKLQQALAMVSPMDALALYRRRQLEAAKLYAFVSKQCAERQRRALRRWAAATIDSDESRQARQGLEAKTAAAAMGAWHPSHGIASLPRLPRVYAHRKPDGSIAIEDLKLYKQFRAGHAGPTESSYWVIRQRVLMGAYPAGVPAFRDARRIVSRADYATSVLLEQIGTFVCLAEPEELARHEPQVDASSLVALEQQRKQQRERARRERKTSKAAAVRSRVAPASVVEPDTPDDGDNTELPCETPWLFERIVRAKHELLRVELAGAAKVAGRHVELAQRELDDLLATLPVPLDESALAPDVRAVRETLTARLALTQQNARKAHETLATVRPLSFLTFPIPHDSVPEDLDALEAFLVQLEDRLRRQERLYVFSMHGHGRTGFVAALLLGRLYGLTATDALERAQRHHDCQYAMHGAGATQVVASPHAAPQVATAARLLAQYNDAIYARVVRENSDAQFVQWRAQQRGQPLDKHASRDGFLISDHVDAATQLAQQRETEQLRRVAKRESAAAQLQLARRKQQREREAMSREEREVEDG